MRRIAAITTIVVALSLAGAACGGGGAVIIPTAAELASTYGTLHSESNPRPVATYCAIEADAVRALKPFLAASPSGSATQGSFEDAAALAGAAADVAPGPIAQDTRLRSRNFANLFGTDAGERYDVGGIGSRQLWLTRYRQLYAAVDRIAAYDLRLCGSAQS